MSKERIKKMVGINYKIILTQMVQVCPKPGGYQKQVLNQIPQGKRKKGRTRLTCRVRKQIRTSEQDG